MALELPGLPNFNVQPPQVPNALDQYGKMLQLKSLMGQQQLLPLQIQEAQQRNQVTGLQVQQQQLELQSQQAMMKAWSDPDFLKNFTGTDKASASGLGFDPDALTSSLISKGVLPKDAMAMTGQFVDRSQKIATTQKDIAQTGEANAVLREKGFKVLGDRLADILDVAKDDPTKGASLLAQLKQDLVTNRQAFAGVPQDDLAHVYGADLAHLPAMASLLGFDKTIADFHKSQADAQKSAQEAINVTPEGAATKAGAEAKARLDVESSPEAIALAGKKAAIEANARQVAAQGSPADAGHLLASGDLTLADLKSRGTTPKFITQAVAAAQKEKPTYNPADEVIAEQVAKSPSANQFFGSANSLISKGGTLDQLAELGKNIPQHDWPVLNSIDDWQKLARGKGPLAGYAATALRAADDYGKVMGGGNASDHARDAALALFAKAASPEQRADAIAATRGAVQSQRDSRIGNNQFLKRQYGVEVGGQAGGGGGGGVPTGATHIGTSSLDGKRYYLDANGRKLGVAQ